MSRPLSKIHEGWWDYTTLDPAILKDAAELSAEDVLALERPGFRIRSFNTLESFYLAEALEYIEAWKSATDNAPAGICGPIGPTEQLPLVAQLVNELEIDLHNCHFWGMDEWNWNGKEISADHPLSFARADRELCFDRIDSRLQMPEDHIHFPAAANLSDYTASFDAARCRIMQGGQGEVKHWAFNDPPKREGDHSDAPPTPVEYRRLPARVVELHPLTLVQNARTSFAGRVGDIPTHALTVGPVETWKADRVSIWHAGQHDNAFGMRLTSLMISKGVADSAVPMSLLTDHPDVVFNFYRPALGSTASEMH
jgi:glucosamine-6-phosphate deaminase